MLSKILSCLLTILHTARVTVLLNVYSMHSSAEIVSAHACRGRGSMSLVMMTKQNKSIVFDKLLISD